jgi:putative CocE/NonD family hydrolase
LRQSKTDEERESPVEVFLIGENRWRSFSSWPPREARAVHWYLRSNGDANSDARGGTLSLDPPPSSEPSDRFAYDPLHPFIPASLRTPDRDSPFGADLPANVGRSDVLTYISAALESDVEITGSIELQLTAAATSPNADWFAILSDVAPDGRDRILAYGAARARARNSKPVRAPASPGEAADIKIIIGPTAYRFPKGHRIQIAVTGSLFPIYARNLNTDADELTTTRTAIAQQTIAPYAASLTRYTSVSSVKRRGET